MTIGSLFSGIGGMDQSWNVLPCLSESDATNIGVVNMKNFSNINNPHSALAHSPDFNNIGFFELGKSLLQQFDIRHYLNHLLL